jgi:hypothetical protein
MSETERERALSDFEYAIAFGDNRSAVVFALADANGEPLTVAEAQAHTTVNTTTVRQILARLVELGLAEETSRSGRLGFRFTEHGLLGFRAWEAKARAVAESHRAQARPTAALYRWRVKGFASRRTPVDTAAAREQFAAQGVELIEMSGEGSLLVDATYEVDAPDETAALQAAGAVGWPMQGMMAKAECIGLAVAVPLRDGHALRFTDTDGPSAAAALETAVSDRLKTLAKFEATERLQEDLKRARDVVARYLNFVGGADDADVPLPDDDQLVEAVEHLWEQLDAVGVRAIGDSFAVSERELREQFRAIADDEPEPQGVNWDDALTERLERYRAQGRLAS